MFTNNWAQSDLFQINSAPLSPSNTQTDWNEIISKSTPISLSNSGKYLNFDLPTIQEQQSLQSDAVQGQAPFIKTEYLPPATVDYEFNKIFDNESLFSNELSTTPEETTNSNSPQIKVERPSQDVIPLLLSERLKSIQKTNDLTPKSLESIFDTKDILKDEPEVAYGSLSRRRTTGSILSDISDSDQASRRGSSTETTCTKNKRRAPRKRLTESQKQAHNKIEKKYRININAKIAGLQKIIPSVALEKPAFETGSKQGTSYSTEDVPLEETSNRLNKSMILEKAIDYILFLQKENASIRKELESVRSSL